MRPELTIPRALFRTFSASTRLPQQFQLFQPMGGVRAMVSPTTMRNFFSARPAEFLARRVTVYSPSFFSAPEISPDLESRCRPEGNESVLNSIGRAPVAGIR